MSSNHQLSQSSTKSLAMVPTMEALTLGMLSAMVVIAFRAEFHRSLPLLYGESFATLALPIAGLLFVLKKVNSDARSVSQQYWGLVLPIFALAYSFLPVFLQPLTRRLGCGDAFEVVALTMLMHAAWFLTIFSQFKNFARVAFMLNAVLVLFICFMSQSYFVMTFAVIFAAISLWWLIGDYWSRVKHKAIDAESTALPVRTWALVFSVVLVLGTGTLASSLGPIREAVSLAGFMPASGGDSGDWSDDLARSGIGDGNMLTAGQNASTTGAVDSDQFIEDDKPSLYDISAEKFDGPIKKIRKRRNRAIALDVKAKHMEKVIQSEQSGRTFRTVRETSVKEMELENRRANALFFLEGSVPVRLTMDYFWHFDGIDWGKGEFGEWGEGKLFVPSINLDKSKEKPWYNVRSVEREFLTTRRAHRVKIMRLSSNSLPSPAMLLSWHIHRMDLKNMFYFDDQGKIRASGEFLPTHTMIDMVSQVPNYHVLRTIKNPQLVNHPNPLWEWFDTWVGVGSAAGTSVGKFDPRETGTDALEVQIPDNKAKQELEDLVRKVTKDKRVGWNQVEAIVNHFRNNFRYAPGEVVDPECDNSVSWFLENGAGPSYLFATAATQALRSAGYKTRMVRGFLVQQKDYDRVAKQSIVTSDNFHIWPEVCVDGWNWIPVEPTPGFPIPYSHQTLLQWFQAKVSEALAAIWNNPITSLCCLAVVVTLFCLRMFLLVGFAHWFWQLFMLLSPSRRLKLTRQLIDLRFWAAGFARPRFASIGTWYPNVNSEASSDFLKHWYQSNYRSTEKSNVKNLNQMEITAACRQIASQFTLKNIKKSLTSRGNS